jgi:hypothetical protein
MSSRPRTWSAWRARPVDGTRSSSRTTRPSHAPEEGGDTPLAIDLRLRLGRVLLDEVKRPRRRARAVRRGVRGRREQRRSDGRAGAALPRDGALRGAAQGIYERSAILGEGDERKRILYAIAELYEKEIKDVARAIVDVRAGARGGADGRAGALAALDRLYRAQERLGGVRRGPAQAHRARGSEEGLIDLKCASATRSRSTSVMPQGRSRTTARCC